MDSPNTAPHTGESVDSRPLLPALPQGKRPTRHIVTQNGVALSLEDVHAIAIWYRELRVLLQVAKVVGIDESVVRRYVNRGDPRRGIPPLKSIAPEDLPPLPAAWKQRSGRIPEAPPPVMGVDPAGEGAEGAPLPALLAPVPPPAPGHPPRRPAEAPSGLPKGLPAPTPPTAAAPAQNSQPGAAGANPAPTPPPTPGVDVGHTLGVANAEMVRLARNARALLNARIRGLAKLARGLDREDAPRLTKGERDLLMVFREVRVTAYDVVTLYRTEAAILGIGTGAGVAPPAAGEEEAPQLGPGDPATLEELAAQVKHLLGPNPNEAVAAGASPFGGMPVTVHRSAFDLAPEGGTPPSGGSEGGARGR